MKTYPCDKLPPTMKREPMALLALFGAVIPFSMLIRRFFELPNDGFFGFILPSIAAVAVVGLVHGCQRQA